MGWVTTFPLAGFIFVVVSNYAKVFDAAHYEVHQGYTRAQLIHAFRLDYLDSVTKVMIKWSLKLLLLMRRVGFCVTYFGACTAFTDVMAYTLAKSPK